MTDTECLKPIWAPATEIDGQTDEIGASEDLCSIGPEVLRRLTVVQSGGGTPLTGLPSVEHDRKGTSIFVLEQLASH